MGNQVSAKERLQGVVALIEQGKTEMEEREWDRATASFARALQVAQEGGLRAEAATVLLHDAMCARAVGDTARAIDALQGSAELAREADDAEAESVALFRKGKLMRERGDPQGALVALERALDVQRRSQLPAEVATLKEMGHAFKAARAYRRALGHYKMALELARAARDARTEADLLSHMGATCSTIGETASAIEHYSTALPLLREQRQRRAEAFVLVKLGAVHASGGAFETATSLLEAALAIYRGCGDKAGEAQALHEMGSTHFFSGAAEDAQQMFAEELDIRRMLSEDGRPADYAHEATALNNVAFTAFYATGRAAEACDAAFEQCDLLESSALLSRSVASRAALERSCRLLESVLVGLHPPRLQDAMLVADSARSRLVEEQEPRKAAAPLAAPRPSGFVTMKLADIASLRRYAMESNCAVVVYSMHDTPLRERRLCAYVILPRRLDVGFAQIDIGDGAMPADATKAADGALVLKHASSTCGRLVDADLQSLSTDANGSFFGRKSLMRQSSDEALEALQRLYGLFIAPIEHLLRGVERVSIVPDPEATRCGVPFHALYNAESGMYFCEEHSVAVCRSIQMLLKIYDGEIVTPRISALGRAPSGSVLGSFVDRQRSPSPVPVVDFDFVDVEVNDEDDEETDAIASDEAKEDMGMRPSKVDKILGRKSSERDHDKADRVLGAFHQTADKADRVLGRMSDASDTIAPQRPSSFLVRPEPLLLGPLPSPIAELWPSKDGVGVEELHRHLLEVKAIGEAEEDEVPTPDAWTATLRGMLSKYRGHVVQVQAELAMAMPEDGSEETRTSAGLASPAALLEQIEAMLRSDYAPIDRERLGVLQQRVEWATRMLDPRVWGRFAVFTAHNKH